MNLYKKLNKSSKYAITFTTVLIATTAVAAILPQIQITAPDVFDSATPTDSFVLDGSAKPSTEINQLEWSRCLVGQTFTDGACTGSAKEFTTWEDALTNAVTAEQAADGWRVPNIKELMLITDNTKAFPAINKEVFSFAEQLTFNVEVGDRIYTPQPAATSSPYIWSSTPKMHKKALYKGWTKLTPEESAIKTEVNRQEATYVYALDLAQGIPDAVFRDGKARGELKDKDGNSINSDDPNSLKKARYVLLVKDIPKA